MNSQSLVGEFANNEYLTQEEQQALLDLTNNAEVPHPSIFQGKIIVFEGADKLGKSTLIKLLSLYLSRTTEVPCKIFTFPNRQDHMYLVKVTKDPESTIQQKILSHALSHALTYPMILNHTVSNGLALCDRYWFSNLVYPPVLNNMSSEVVWSVEHTLVQPPTPHLTVFFLSDTLYPKFSSNRQDTDALDKLAPQDRKKITLKYEELYHKFSSNTPPVVSQHTVVFPVHDQESISCSLARLTKLVYDSVIGDKLSHQKDGIQC